mmetsp:Transcript_17442/g.50825  ORF Transcript_17442/g.50825 Transcript_17442/m.50825 type:complete len:420 (-) Transcript_17442:1453-2712(-)
MIVPQSVPPIYAQGLVVQHSGRFDLPPFPVQVRHIPQRPGDVDLVRFAPPPSPAAGGGGTRMPLIAALASSGEDVPLPRHPYLEGALAHLEGLVVFAVPAEGFGLLIEGVRFVAGSSSSASSVVVVAMAVMIAIMVAVTTAVVTVVAAALRGRCAAASSSLPFVATFVDTAWGRCAAASSSLPVAATVAVVPPASDAAATLAKALLRMGEVPMAPLSPGGGATSFSSIVVVGSSSHHISPRRTMRRRRRGVEGLLLRQSLAELGVYVEKGRVSLLRAVLSVQPRRLPQRQYRVIPSPPSHLSRSQLVQQSRLVALLALFGRRSTTHQIEGVPVMVGRRRPIPIHVVQIALPLQYLRHYYYRRPPVVGRCPRCTSTVGMRTEQSQSVVQARIRGVDRSQFQLDRPHTGEYPRGAEIYFSQ